MVVTAPPPRSDPPETIEGGVIEDARQRQRRHRRRGAVLVAGGLATALSLMGFLGGGGGSGVSHGGLDRGYRHAAGGQDGSRSLLTVPFLPAVSQLGLLARGVGWVDSGSGMYLTRTGGRRWTQVKAIGAGAELGGWSSSSATQLTFSVADGGRTQQSCGSGCMSVTAASPGTSASQRGQIVITTNAGRTWSSRAFPTDAVPASASFVNRRHGFVIAYTPAVHHDPRASLYETRDGAHTWSRIARLPFQGLLSFANARDGLGGGAAMSAGLVDSGAIYRTSDGGRSWIRTSLCRPAVTYVCQAPHLFHSGRGVVPVTAENQRTGSSRVAVYTTRNNGVSWTSHVLPNTPRLINGPFVPFSAPNAEDLFAWVAPYLYTSTDAGATWSRRKEPALIQRGAPQQMSQISFANASYGWYGLGPMFAFTTDGGIHWTNIGRTH